MPLLLNKYNPYFPDPNSPANFNCGDEAYCHLVAVGDEIKTQLHQTPCNANEIEDPQFEDITLGSEKLNNPSFTGNANNWITAGGALPSNGWAYDSNNIEHTPGTQLSVYQTTLAGALTAGYYQIEIDITRVSGSVRVRMGDGGTATLTDYFAETGTYTVNVYYSDILDQVVAIDVNPDDDFDGTINSISVKEITFNLWTPTAGWLLQDGYACHTSGNTGTLEQSVADYITADAYYEINLTVTGYVSGTCDVYIANVLAGTLNANGTVSFYATPTLTGVVSFDPSTDFIGCIDFLPFASEDREPGLFELKNDHLAYLVDPDGVTEYNIGQYFNYYERWVTLIFPIDELELPYDCYTIKIIDACVVSGENVVINPNFNDNGDDWTPASQQIDYSSPSGEIQLSFNPLTGSDYVVNGDFSGGAASWTLGAGWSIAGGGALHTAGSTATLLQSVTVPVRVPAPTVNRWWIEFSIIGRTAGSVTVTLEDSTSAAMSTNDTNQIILLNPTSGGTVNLYFTPTSNFDGTIDDVSIHYNNGGWSSAFLVNNTANPNILAGNYGVDFDIVAISDPHLGARVGLQGQGGSLILRNTVGSHTDTILNYVPGGQMAQIYVTFGSGYFKAGTINIDNIRIYPIEPFEATYTSECLKYGLSFNNSKMMVGYCDQPSFGYEFDNTGFAFQQRAIIRSIAPSYPTTSALQKSGTGNARLTYAEVEKFWELHTTFASETFHDTMAVMIRCDHFLIGEGADNGVEYVVNPDDYTPEWLGGGVYALAPAVMILRIKDGGQVFNRHI